MQCYSMYYMTSAAPGGMASNAVDMSKWLLAQVNGHPDLDPEVMQETYRMSMFMDLGSIFQRPFNDVTLASFESYGLGYTRGYYRGSPSLIKICLQESNFRHYAPNIRIVNFIRHRSRLMFGVYNGYQSSTR